MAAIERTRPSITDKMFNDGTFTIFNKEEISASEDELFGDAFKEHDRLKAEGKLDEIQIEDEADEWTEEDDQAVNEAWAEEAEDLEIFEQGAKVINMINNSPQDDQDFVFPDDLDKIQPES